jgi:perosamine synthetase
MQIEFPVNSFEITEKDIAKVVETLQLGLISGDTYIVRDFEEKFAVKLGAKNAIAVNNGSTALDLAFTLVDLKPGDEVIIPSFTIASCLFPILRAGATPIFVDCNSETWQMNPQEVISKMSSKTKAILVVHTYGLAVEMENLIKLCTAKKVILIEDCAEAHGLKYNGRHCGNYGDIATFSFYANKIVTTGEGGMLVVKDREIAQKARKIRNLSFNSGRRFVHDEIGWNYRLSSIQAALGISQIDRIEEYVEHRQKVALRYRENLKDFPGIKWQANENDGSKNIYWVNALIFDSNLYGLAEDISLKLLGVGIETRPFFYPLHLQPVLEKYNFSAVTLPVTEYIAKQGLYLPGGNKLNLGSVDLICERLVRSLSYK